MKRPLVPPILRTVKTVGIGLLAAVVLLITGTEASAAPSGSPCSAAARACVDLSSQQAWLMRGGNVTYGPVPVRPVWCTDLSRGRWSQRRRCHWRGVWFSTSGAGR
ncbi:MAG: hypothetical protein JWM45_2471, partial [Pseudonocardiales bacterium]|nr:hypothetical protein [Pseudonocardiales bacterium]